MYPPGSHVRLFGSGKGEYIVRIMAADAAISLDRHGRWQCVPRPCEGGRPTRGPVSLAGAVQAR
jgi:hypothetical protein